MKIKLILQKHPKTLSLLHKLALAVLLAGAGGALALVLHAGRNNNSVLLVTLFVVWVLSPFAGLLIVSVMAKRWNILTRLTLYSLTLVITFCSLTSYSGAFSPRGAKLTGLFLIVPLISWLLLAIVIPITASLVNRNSSGAVQKKF